MAGPGKNIPAKQQTQKPMIFDPAKHLEPVEAAAAAALQAARNRDFEKAMLISRSICIFMSFLKELYQETEHPETEATIRIRTLSNLQDVEDGLRQARAPWRGAPVRRPANEPLHDSR
jgi:hypothetical protein